MTILRSFTASTIRQCWEPHPFCWEPHPFCNWCQYQHCACNHSTPVPCVQVLNFLRDGWCAVPTTAEERKELAQEARFYQVGCQGRA